MSDGDVVGGQDLNDVLGVRLEVLFKLLNYDRHGQAQAIGVVVLGASSWSGNQKLFEPS